MANPGGKLPCVSSYGTMSPRVQEYSPSLASTNSVYSQASASTRPPIQNSTANSIRQSSQYRDPFEDQLNTIPPRAFTSPIPSHTTQPSQGIQRTQSAVVGPRNQSLAPSYTNSTRTLVNTGLGQNPERIWNTDPQATSSAQRTLHKPLRGVATKLEGGEDKWLDHVQTALGGYIFQNPDLLEEALESPESSVVVVGMSNRVCKDGNEGLARVGQAVMKLVLKDQCYLFGFAESMFIYFLCITAS
jgi:hypothetical protein